MRCPRCGGAEELVVAIHLRGVPHGADGHDTVHDWSVVTACPACGSGALRSFSHDCDVPGPGGVRLRVPGARVAAGHPHRATQDEGPGTVTLRDDGVPEFAR